MDTFMDKLAQKFTAQELIKANTAAETEEMNRLKVQVEEYTGCLNRMKQICVEMEQAVESAKDKMDTAQLNTDELRDQLLEIWQTMQNAANETGADSVGSALLVEQIADLKTAQSTQFEALHNELDECIDDILATQTAQVESLKNMQAEQIENIRGVQAEQMEGIRGLQEEQTQSIRALQAEQMEGIRALKEDQLEDMRVLQAEQTAELRGMLQAEQGEDMRALHDAQLDSIKKLQDEQFENVRNSLEDQLDNMRSMVKAQISGLKNNQEGQIDGLRGALDKQNETLETQLGEMKENLESQLSGSNEFVHKECVKVYRNVQAVVGEENNKQIENLDYTLKPMSRRVSRLQKISIAALVASALSVLIQILDIMQVI